MTTKQANRSGLTIWRSLKISSRLFEARKRTWIAMDRANTDLVTMTDIMNSAGQVIDEDIFEPPGPTLETKGPEDGGRHHCRHAQEEAKPATSARNHQGAVAKIRRIELNRGPSPDYPTHYFHKKTGGLEFGFSEVLRQIFQLVEDGSEAQAGISPTLPIARFVGGA